MTKTAQTVRQRIQAQMLNLQAARVAELEEIRQKLAEAREAKEAAELAISDATKKTDLTAFEEASEAAEKASRAVEMYSRRLEQIREREFISEAESDQVINDLLSYEEELEERLKENAAGPLSKLKELVQAYLDEVAATEKTLASWQRDIHPNFHTRGRVSFSDPLTGERSDRAPAPVPVHPMAFLGCEEALYLSNFLKPLLK